MKGWSQRWIILSGESGNNFSKRIAVAEIWNCYILLPFIPNLITIG